MLSKFHVRSSMFAVGMMLAMALLPLAAVSAASPRTPDSDNNFDNANPIASGDTVSGSVDISDDRSDYYKISNVLAGQTVKASITFSNSGANLNLYLCTSWGTQLFSSGGGGTTRGNTGLAYVNGTYYLQVRSDGGASAYTLTVKVDTPPELVPGVPVTGDLSAATDDRTDYYRIFLKGSELGETEAAWIDMSKTNPSAGVNRYFRDILNYNGTYVYNESWSNNARTNVTAAATHWGWYYYQISCSQSSTSYTVNCGKYRAESDGNNDFLNATAVPKKTAITNRTVDKAFDHYDWYSYKYVTNDMPRIYVQCSNQNLPLYAVSVYDSKLNRLASDNNQGWPWYDRWVNLTASSVTADDTYYVVVMVQSAGWNNDGNAVAIYNINITTENRPPSIDPLLLDVPMDEDGSFKILTPQYFKDPDEDPLTFRLTSAGHVKGSYNSTTMEMTVYPVPNWFGREISYLFASDGRNPEVQMVLNVTARSVNDLPIVNRSIANISFMQGGSDSSVDLSKVFVDADVPYGDVLKYSVVDNRSLAVTIQAGGKVVISGPPAFHGNLTMYFSATDNASAVATASCNVSVIAPNQAPRLISPLGEMAIDEDTTATVDLKLHFEDPDGDVMTFRVAGNNRVTVAIESESLLASFTPAPETSGYYEDITITAVDSKGLAGDFAVVRATVVPVNDPPLITVVKPAGNLTIAENESVEFKVTVTDVETPRDLTVRWYLDDLMVQFIETTWTYRSNFTSAGNRTVRVVAGDGTDNSTVSWTVTVSNVNRPPANVKILSPKATDTFKEGSAVIFAASAEDADGDELTYTWYDSLKALGTGPNLTVSGLSPGAHPVTLEVTDGIDTFVTKPLQVMVKKNSSPVLGAVLPSNGQKFEEGKKVRFGATATDPDGDILAFAWTEKGILLSNESSFYTSKLPVGKHSVTLTVSDGLSSTNQTVEVVIEDAKPAGLPVAALAGGAVAVLVIVAVAALLFMRRKKPAPEAPVPVAEEVVVLDMKGL